ncbi:UNVERIFIED_CONTAM: 2-keto-3-deoxy-L-rhamnonate aldolase RhmA [Acetivibrio alkalicellulosi]
MALKLMYITNDIEIAQIAEQSGVDWIFIDLEINGKEKRQGHLDTVISRHQVDDISKIKRVINRSEVLVRINPIFDGSMLEIDKIINNGADIVMLPFFKTKEEVGKFIDYVSGRAKTMLLLETTEAVENVDSILSVKGINYIHIGLNDLHLSYGMKFMFEPLVDGTVEKLFNKIRSKDIPCGFGGIANLGDGDLPAEYIIAEHYRLGSAMAILSRSFCNMHKIESIDEAKNLFNKGVSEIREFEKQLKEKENEFFEENKIIIKKKVLEIINHKVSVK